MARPPWRRGLVGWTCGAEIKTGKKKMKWCSTDAGWMVDEDKDD